MSGCDSEFMGENITHMSAQRMGHCFRVRTAVAAAAAAVGGSGRAWHGWADI